MAKDRTLERAERKIKRGYDYYSLSERERDAIRERSDRYDVDEYDGSIIDHDYYRRKLRD